MTNSLRNRIAAGLTAITVVGIAQTAFGQTLTVPPVPPGLQVPAGNVAFMKAQASGTQNYICRPSASGHSWTFLGPQATLFLTFKWMNNDIRQQIATHFLSPNPAENGLPRATWQSSLDTSAVWGKGVASSIDPNFVASGAIPWLLVQTVGAQPGPAGGAFLTRTTFIHRLNTSGGVAPTTGCGASNVGEAVLAPYSTDYYFYQANHPM